MSVDNFHTLATHWSLLFFRVGGLLWVGIFPQTGNASIVARIVLTAALATVLVQVTPASAVATGGLLPAMARELVLGAALGLAVAIMLDWMQIAAQVVALQAGFAYATTIDPTNSVDGGLLPLFAKGGALCFFFSMGLDREYLRLLLEHTLAHPVGQTVLTSVSLSLLSHLFSESLNFAVRLALPITAFLLMSDVLLALITRLHSQLQMIGLVFPLKLAIWPTLSILLLPAMSRLFETFSRQTMHSLHVLLRGG